MVTSILQQYHYNKILPPGPQSQAGAISVTALGELYRRFLHVLKIANRW